MNTENQISPITISKNLKEKSNTAEYTEIHFLEYNQNLTSTLEERKGNAVRPLSLRPNRSVKKNVSLKPLGLKLR